MGVLGGVFVLKSGLRILIRAPEVPCSVPTKMAKNHFSVVQNGSQSAPQNANLGDFGYFGGTEKGAWGARIKILRPLFNTNTPPKTPNKTLWEPFWTP